MMSHKKVTDAILWSKREQVSYRQCAYTDEVTYKVPFIGTYDSNRMANAVARKLSSRGIGIAGSSYGNTSARFLGRDSARPDNILIYTSFYIGD